LRYIGELTILDQVREPSYFILVSLMTGRLHGYAIAKRARQLSNDRVRIAAGTLYGALDRMVDEGLVVVDAEEEVKGKTRRYYRITKDGEQAAFAEAERMRSAAAAIDMSAALGTVMP